MAVRCQVCFVSQLHDWNLVTFTSLLFISCVYTVSTVMLESVVCLQCIVGIVW